MCKLSPEEAYSESTIRLGGTDQTCQTEGVVSCDLQVFNELTKSYETLHCLKFMILDGDHECILGLPTIRKFNLTKKISSFFDSQEGAAANSCASAPVPREVKATECPCAHSDCKISCPSNGLGRHEY